MLPSLGEQQIVDKGVDLQKNRGVILECSETGNTYLILGDKGVHDKLIRRIESVLMRLDVQSIESLMLVQPSTTAV